MTDQIVVSRNKRKEMGKQLKRQRIEQSGGIRPRVTPDDIASPKEPKTVEVKGTTATFNNNNNNNNEPPKKTDGNPKRIGFGEMSMPSKSKKNIKPSKANNKNKNNKKSNDPHGQHRFGRVMDIVPCRNKPRYSTISIAIPGSIVANCQTRELKTCICGQIARAATIYHVDEIIVYDDKLTNSTSTNPGYHQHWKKKRKYSEDNTDNNNGKGDDKTNEKNTTDETLSNHHHHGTKNSDPHSFMARILQYCECPQYLRRHFFPMHTDLQFVGLLPPIDPPHHVRADDHCKYREGVVLEEKYVTDPDKVGKLVNCGIRGKPVLIDQKLPQGIRCTVQIEPEAYEANKTIVGTVVSPSTPREENGTYWGYTVRLASSIQECFNNCPFGPSYDLKIGTSERGTLDIDNPTFSTKLSSILASNRGNNNTTTTKTSKKQRKASSSNGFYRHALIVFGGVAGIEECIDADEGMKLSGADSYKLFDVWLNICPYQGSKTIRTEEAVMIALAKLSAPLASTAAETDDTDDEKDDDNNNDDDDESDVENNNKKYSSASNNKLKANVLATFSDDEPSEESSDDDDDEEDTNHKPNNPIIKKVASVVNADKADKKDITNPTTKATDNEPKSTQSSFEHAETREQVDDDNDSAPEEENDDEGSDDESSSGSNNNDSKHQDDDDDNDADGQSTTTGSSTSGNNDNSAEDSSEEES